MSTKGKKKGAKGGKKDAKDKNKMSQVDKTFYELTIADLNKKLSRLRAYIATTEETHTALKEKLRSLEEDRSDVAAHLERTLAERNDTIASLEEQLVELTKVRNQEKEEAAQHIKDIEIKSKAMHDQLTSEIKLLNGKLNSLDEFRIQRDNLLAKFDDQESELKEKERQHQETIYYMEQKAIVEKDAMKKEVEAKLLQVSEDFTRSSEIRNAGYTRRLIRENIALQKEIEKLVASQLKMQQDFVEQAQKHKEMTEQYAALNQLKTQLIYSSQNKINIIEKLTMKYERLKTKYMEVAKFRNLYEQLMTRDVCEHYNQNDMTKKLRNLGLKVEMLKVEKNNLIAIHQQHEYEIISLRNAMKQIKDTITTAINIKKIDDLYASSGTGGGVTVTPETVEELEGLHKLKRANLLSELINIIISNEANVTKAPSVESMLRSESSLYRPGKMGFLPQTRPSIMEIFKFDPTAQITSTDESAEFKLKEKDSKIIPKERADEAGTIIDVELGSTLYVSSSHEDLEMVQVEEEPLEYGEEATSSEDVYQPEPDDKQQQASQLPATTPQPPQPPKPPQQPQDIQQDGLIERRGSYADNIERSSELIFSEEDSLNYQKSRSSYLKSISHGSIFPSIDNEGYNIQLTH